MGLDSVELLMEFEKHFNIEISDKDASEINTVQEMVECISKYLNISDQGESLKDTIFKKIKAVFHDYKYADSTFSYSDKIFTFLSINEEESWLKISVEINIPFFIPIPKNDRFSKIFKNRFERLHTDTNSITVEQFTTAICAQNHEKLIDKENIKSKFEILISVIGITTDKLGINIFDIHPSKNFINDLGMS